jgi:hypothetical protein
MCNVKVNYARRRLFFYSQGSKKSLLLCWAECIQAAWQQPEAEVQYQAVRVGAVQPTAEGVRQRRRVPVPDEGRQEPLLRAAGRRAGQLTQSELRVCTRHCTIYQGNTSKKNN